uniref:Integrase zinc-binding domain-containing protein n=1 Tax=Strigamia maritima TaxID=126957 RepID=T1IJZ7_STRMM
MKKRILWSLHGHPLASHAGVSRTLHRGQQIYFWPRMKWDILNYIRRCSRCQACKPRRKLSCENIALGPYAPFDCWSIDLMGPKPQPKEGIPTY